MWKTGYLRKYHIKPIAASASIVFALLFILALSINIALSKTRAPLANEIEKFCEHKVTIDSIAYAFPNKFVVKNARLWGPASSGQKQLIHAPRIIAYFSIFDVLINHRLSISDCIFKNTEIDDYQYFVLHKDHWMKILNKLPKQNFDLRIVNSMVNFEDSTQGRYLINFDLQLNTQGEALKAKGRVSKDKVLFVANKKSFSKGQPFFYELQGLIKESMFSLEQLALKYGSYEVNIWGNKVKQEARLFNYDKFPKPHLKNFSKPVAQLTNPLDVLFNISGLKELPKYHIDINADLEITATQLNIKRMDFLHGQTPVYLSGQIALFEPFEYSAKLSINLNESDIMPEKQIKNVIVKISGLWENKAFHSDANLKFQFQDKQAAKTEEEVEIDLKNLSSRLTLEPYLKFYLQTAEIFLPGETRPKRIELTDLQAVFNGHDPEYRFVDFYSLLYGGSIKGRMGVKTKAEKHEIVLRADVDHVALNKLENLSEDFSKMSGDLSGKMYFNSIPQKKLSGEIMVHQGKMYDLEYLTWVAQYFDISALKAIALSQAYSQFDIDDNGLRFKNVNFQSEDINVNGQFTMSRDQLVKSQFSVLLTRDLVQQSTRFKPLLKLVDKDSDRLKFDFKLSGHLNALNFQWIPSELKQQIQDKVPNFMERHIERQVESAIDPVSLN